MVLWVLQIQDDALLAVHDLPQQRNVVALVAVPASGSPVGCSILITSAPKSPSIAAANGAASKVPMRRHFIDEALEQLSGTNSARH